MEADWEFEVGWDAPVIDARWEGLVDLQKAPGAAWELAEVRELPALGVLLERLNAGSSPVWTSKCDFFPALQAEEFDADEMDAGAGACTDAVACYIDMLAKAGGGWCEPRMVEAVCRQVCGALRPVALRCCRADLIVRRAVLDLDSARLGITAYVSACGSTGSEARDTLATALTAFAHALCGNSTLQ
ncbi:MAG: hypothetical protein ABSE46_26015 [Terracidiphilus sp.]|jgi:hypothetical protein